jgi:UDP-N-acetylglucosamine 1-carboxyvinyltransferase
VNATDLRAGAAMVIAALMAQGSTEIGGVSYILRGYERFDEKLRSIGAHVEKITVDEP